MFLLWKACEVCDTCPGGGCFCAVRIVKFVISLSCAGSIEKIVIVLSWLFLCCEKCEVVA